MISRIAISTFMMLAIQFPISIYAQEVETQPTAGAVVEEKPATRMTPELLMKLGRVDGGVVSSDGKKIAYTVRRYQLEENKGYTSLHLLDLTDSQDRVLVNDWSSLDSVQWAKVGETESLYFVGTLPKAEEEGEANEEAKGDQGKAEDGNEDEGDGKADPAASPQAWRVDVVTGDLLQMTTVEDGIANLKVSSTGDHIVYTVDVKLDDTVNDLYQDLPKADARIIDSLMYRHWNAWHDFKYSHLHVAPILDNGVAGESRDLMSGIKADCPVPPFGGSEQFNWSPDGKEIAFTMKNVEDWAQSTNSDVYVINIEGDAPPKNITEGMAGYDNDPSYSPDGKYLAFQLMERASFEADKNRLMLIDRETGQVRELSAGLDQTTHDAVWMPDSKSLLFTSEYRGTNQLFQVSIDSPGATQVSEGRFNWNVADVMPVGKSAVVTKMNMLRPTELSILNLADSIDKVITHVNDEIYKSLELPIIEERWVDATDGKKIHCWVIHPPDFDPAAEHKWPLLTYFQGGPQGQIGQWFSYRWNFHLMAANGYVVVAPNRRGLPGFGREWNDQISGDWGGQAMKDILSATDDVIEEPYIDDKRVAGIGASFGGYTAYWMMGHHRDRFCTLVAHAGVFNLESMYGSTEELFFVNWDLGGPYWKNNQIQEAYNNFSPHRFVGKWNIPLLVIHGEKDFRVPITQGMEAFTAAQVMGIPSRFLYFPEEGHWVLGAQNSVLWQRVFYDWLDRYCKNSHSQDGTPVKTKP